MTDIYKEGYKYLSVCSTYLYFAKEWKGEKIAGGLCVKLKNDVTDLPIWQGMCLLYYLKICRGKYMSVYKPIV